MSRFLCKGHGQLQHFTCKNLVVGRLCRFTHRSCGFLKLMQKHITTTKNMKEKLCGSNPPNDEKNPIPSMGLVYLGTFG